MPFLYESSNNLKSRLPHGNYHMLSESDIQSSLDSIVQQIQWRAQPQLSLALQVMDAVAVYQPQLLFAPLLDNVMTGLSFLAQETQIRRGDTNKITASKVELRKLSLRFINNIQNDLPSGKYEDTVKLWTDIALDYQEFSEVRNA